MAEETTANKKPHRKLTVDFFDEEAFAAAHPQFMETVTITRPNRELAYPMIKAMHKAGVQVPGVRAWYAHEEPKPEPPAEAENETPPPAGEPTPPAGDLDNLPVFYRKQATKDEPLPKGHPSYINA